MLSGDVNKNFDGLLSESEPVEDDSNSVLGYPLSVNGPIAFSAWSIGQGRDRISAQKYAKCVLTGRGGTVCCWSAIKRSRPVAGRSSEFIRTQFSVIGFPLMGRAGFSAVPGWNG